MDTWSRREPHTYKLWEGFKLGPVERNLTIAKVQFFVFLLVVGVISGCSTQPESTKPIAKAPTAAVTPADLGMLRSDFAEPFIPTVEGASEKALAQTIEAYDSDSRPKARKVDLFETFLKENPDDPWAPSVSLNLGSYYRKTGRFTRSLANLERAWKQLGHAEEPRLKALADRALGEYALTLAHIGRMEDLAPLLEEVQGRSVRGSATEWLTAARVGLDGMRKRPEISFLCGPGALRRISEHNGTLDDKAQALIDSLPSTTKGTSLAQVYQLSKKLGMDYQLAYREEPGSPFLTPAVVHWTPPWSTGKWGTSQHYSTLKVAYILSATTLPDSVAKRFR